MVFPIQMHIYLSLRRCAHFTKITEIFVGIRIHGCLRHKCQILVNFLRWGYIIKRVKSTKAQVLTNFTIHWVPLPFLGVLVEIAWLEPS